MSRSFGYEGSCLKHISVALLGDILYYVDKDGVLCSLREGQKVVECEDLKEPAAICAGVGGCGNYRIFIADAEDMGLKVFDPLNRRLDLLATLPGVPTAIAKEECRLVVAVENAIVEFDLKSLEITGSYPV